MAPQRRSKSDLALAVFQDGRTQREIARAAGICETTLSLIIHDHRTPRLETVLRLARVLGKSPQSLGLPVLEDTGTLQGGAS